MIPILQVKTARFKEHAQDDTLQCGSVAGWKSYCDTTVGMNANAFKFI